MAEYFLAEHQKLSNSMSLKDRDLYLAGTIATAVVAGRFVFSYLKAHLIRLR